MQFTSSNRDNPIPYQTPAQTLNSPKLVYEYPSEINNSPEQNRVESDIYPECGFPHMHSARPNLPTAGNQMRRLQTRLVHGINDYEAPRLQLAQYPSEVGLFMQRGARKWAERKCPCRELLNIMVQIAERLLYVKFTCFADEMDWSARVKKQRLCWVLEGAASLFYSRCLTQQPNDSLAEWGEIIVDLAMRAYEDVPDITVYSQGCLNKKSGQHAALSKPRTIEDAIDEIQWYEHNNAVIFGSKKAVRFDHKIEAREWNMILRRNQIGNLLYKLFKVIQLSRPIMDPPIHLPG